jgi:hypothetical protein
MNSRFRKLAVESLEGRSVLSTMVEADFNGDGLWDVAAITDANTIAVSLANTVGGYDVSDILSAPKNQEIIDIYAVEDGDHDGDLDIYALASKPSGSFQVAFFRNDGDGTFDFIEPVKWKFPKRFV